LFLIFFCLVPPVPIVGFSIYLNEFFRFPIFHYWGFPSDNSEKKFSIKSKLFIGNIKPGTTEAYLKVTLVYVYYILTVRYRKHCNMQMQSFICLLFDSCFDLIRVGSVLRILVGFGINPDSDSKSRYRFRKAKMDLKEENNKNTHFNSWMFSPECCRLLFFRMCKIAFFLS